MRAQHGSRERAGRRLAVRRGDQGRALGEPGREGIDGVAVDGGEQLPGQCGASTRAGEPRQPADAARDRNLELQQHRASVWTPTAVSEHRLLLHIAGYALF